MPFKSEKQKKWLRINKPEVYERWVREHGTKIQPGKKKKKE
jgi:hypothetical protein